MARRNPASAPEAAGSQEAPEKVTKKAGKKAGELVIGPQIKEAVDTETQNDAYAFANYLDHTKTTIAAYNNYMRMNRAFKKAGTKKAEKVMARAKKDWQNDKATLQRMYGNFSSGMEALDDEFDVGRKAGLEQASELSASGELVERLRAHADESDEYKQELIEKATARSKALEKQERKRQEAKDVAEAERVMKRIKKGVTEEQEVAVETKKKKRAEMRELKRMLRTPLSDQEQDYMKYVMEDGMSSRAAKIQVASDHSMIPADLKAEMKAWKVADKVGQKEFKAAMAEIHKEEKLIADMERRLGVAERKTKALDKAEEKRKEKLAKKGSAIGKKAEAKAEKARLAAERKATRDEEAAARKSAQSKLRAEARAKREETKRLESEAMEDEDVAEAAKKVKKGITPEKEAAVAAKAAKKAEKAEMKAYKKLGKTEIADFEKDYMQYVLEDGMSNEDALARASEEHDVAPDALKLEKKRWAKEIKESKAYDREMKKEDKAEEKADRARAKSEKAAAKKGAGFEKKYEKGGARMTEQRNAKESFMKKIDEMKLKQNEIYAALGLQASEMMVLQEEIAGMEGGFDAFLETGPKFSFKKLFGMKRQMGRLEELRYALPKRDPDSEEGEPGEDKLTLDQVIKEYNSLESELKKNKWQPEAGEGYEYYLRPAPQEVPGFRGKRIVAETRGDVWARTTEDQIEEFRQYMVENDFARSDDKTIKEVFKLANWPENKLIAKMASISGGAVDFEGWDSKGSDVKRQVEISLVEWRGDIDFEQYYAAYELKRQQASQAQWEKLAAGE